MTNKVIQITLPKELVNQVDEAAKEEFANRSEFIRAALIERLKEIERHRAELQKIAEGTYGIMNEEKLYQLLRIKRGSRYFIDLEAEIRRHKHSGLHS